VTRQHLLISYWHATVQQWYLQASLTHLNFSRNQTKIYVGLCVHLERNSLNVYRSENCFGCKFHLKNETSISCPIHLFPIWRAEFEIIKQKAFLYALSSFESIWYDFSIAHVTRLSKSKEKKKQAKHPMLKLNSFCEVYILHSLCTGSRNSCRYSD
jgi:hypothetical protein